MYTVNTFSLPKLGSTPQEYEDAYGFTDTLEPEASNRRFAVADGATETSFSGLWANELVQSFINGQFDELNIETITPVAQAWAEQIEAIRSTKSLSWYAEEKLQQG